jgi:hypothetical protein
MREMRRMLHIRIRIRGILVRHEENWRKGKKPTQNHAEEKKQVRRCNNRKKKIETGTGGKKQKEHNTEM